MSAFHPKRTLWSAARQPTNPVDRRRSESRYAKQMRRLAELEELARLAREQAVLTTHHGTSQALREMASK